MAILLWNKGSCNSFTNINQHQLSSFHTLTVEKLADLVKCSIAGTSHRLDDYSTESIASAIHEISQVQNGLKSVDGLTHWLQSSSKVKYAPSPCLLLLIMPV
jgi:hypothetical protein